MTNDKEIIYSPVGERDSVEEDESDFLASSNIGTGRRRRNIPLLIAKIILFIVPWLTTIILSVTLLRDRSWGHNRFQQTKTFRSQLTYSPAQSAIEYGLHLFDRNPESGPMKFRDPNLVDQAWRDLYSCRCRGIPCSCLEWFANFWSSWRFCCVQKGGIKTAERDEPNHAGRS